LRAFSPRGPGPTTEAATHYSQERESSGERIFQLLEALAAAPQVQFGFLIGLLAGIILRLVIATGSVEKTADDDGSGCLATTAICSLYNSSGFNVVHHVSGGPSSSCSVSPD